MKVDIKYNGEVHEVEMEECSFGVQNTAISKAKKRDGTTDELAAYEAVILACIKTAPFPLTREAIRALPASSGNALIEATKKLTTLEEDLKKNLEKSSGVKK